MRLDTVSSNAAVQVRLLKLINSKIAVSPVQRMIGVGISKKVRFEVLELLPEPFIIASPNLDICFANKAAIKLISPTLNLRAGATFSSFVINQDKKLITWLRKSACTTAFISERFHIETSSGNKEFVFEGCAFRQESKSHVLIRLKPVTAKRKAMRMLSERVGKLTEEVTMRKAAEAKLKESLIELEYARKQLELLALVDSLTAIPNRRSIDETLKREWAKSMRNHEALAVIMIDIDHFKLYNDYYGHQAGDGCLKSVAEAIRRSLRRPTDFVGRYGGEEFLVLLSNTDLESATNMAKTICESVRQLNIPHVASPTAPMVTISLGVNVVTPDVKLMISSFLQSADKALYQAKQNGRNRFQCCFNVVGSPSSLKKKAS